MGNISAKRSEDSDDPELRAQLVTFSGRDASI
jgi:hypothetical protein